MGNGYTPIYTEKKRKTLINRERKRLLEIFEIDSPFKYRLTTDVFTSSGCLFIILLLEKIVSKIIAHL